MISVDKNIPIPRISKYPFLTMDIGDSFYIECTATDIPVWRNRLQSKVCYFRKTSNSEFNISVREWGAGIRVWRTK
jgi:hypothetical protein